MSDETHVIEARPATVIGRIKAAWQYRRYYPILLRDITMRKFRGTILGVWWLILRPLIPTAVAVIAFTYLIEIDTGNLPYGIFFLSGFIYWNLLRSSAQFMSRTMMWMRSLMRKMYLPKLLVPLASIGPPAVELAVTIVALIVLSIVYSFTEGVFYISLSWNLLLFPVCLLLTFALAMSIGMVISVVALIARDIIYSVGYLMQAFMLATPVLYPLSSIPEGGRWIFIVFNPMTGVIETGRWALTGFGAFEPLWLLASVISISLITFLALLFFARAESYLSDIA